MGFFESHARHDGGADGSEVEARRSGIDTTVI
jgi:hypothetical protein